MTHMRTQARRGGLVLIAALIGALLAPMGAAQADVVEEILWSQPTDINFHSPSLAFVDIELDSGSPKACVYYLNAEARLTRAAGSSSVFEKAFVKGTTDCNRRPTVAASIVDSSLVGSAYSTSCGPQISPAIGQPAECTTSQTVPYGGAVPRAVSTVTYKFTVSRGTTVKGCLEYTITTIYGVQVTGRPEPCKETTAWQSP
jgi:hypothetical protein